ncbi:hypothetical protein L202_00907 [Cryptococcus amylolentus CBS 6039]|uniref:Uncharacterized protein n=1 Tax=Cryptococcus amylolentus CBS 6039 TaxID=1295533 RepID=A0A1E3I8Y2_9TREE|nr:hypothetical protein L202_00907 [Cryptococcus amylolentus CBS 6039]ODN85080.1 hypothetical protein L202_00907 [Cryptococcus amylolentus CBS 6039]
MPREDQSIYTRTTITQDSSRRDTASNRSSTRGWEDAGGSSSAQGQYSHSASVTSPRKTEPTTVTVPNDNVEDTIDDLDRMGCQLLSVSRSRKNGKGWTDISYQAVPR